MFTFTSCSFSNPRTAPHQILWVIFSLPGPFYRLRPSQDETGEEGVILLPEEDEKKVRIGGRVVAEKIKQSEHESAGQMKDAYEAGKAAVKVEATDEAGLGVFVLRPVGQFEPLYSLY